MSFLPESGIRGGFVFPPCCLYPVAMGACDRDALHPSAPYFCPPKTAFKALCIPPSVSTAVPAPRAAAPLLAAIPAASSEATSSTGDAVSIPSILPLANTHRLLPASLPQCCC